MKNTPLTEKHKALGAKMVDFAGYEMPVYYSTIKEEHLCVRNNVGVFDVSHMGEFIVRGKQALDLLQKVTTNNVAKLEIGQAQYSCLPNSTGGIVDDLLIYRLTEEMCSEGERAYMLVVNASNIEKDLNWINQHNEFDTQVINISDHTGLLAVQGPNATKVLQPLTELPLGAMKYYHFQKGVFAGIDNVLVSATGYTGAGGFEIYVESKNLLTVWEAIFEAGTSFNILPIGLGARDTLRLEMGYCLYGNDINDKTSPIEAGLSWITKVKKGAFIGQELFAKQKAEGVSHKLVGFKVLDRRVPRQGYSIENEAGEQIGEVTSGTLSPSLEKPIGMGYVNKEYASINTTIYINAGRKTLTAEVVKPPFITK